MSTTRDRKIFAEIRTYERGSLCHRHEFSQLIVGLTGELEISISDKDYRLNPSRVVYVPSNIDHEFEMTKNGEFMVFDFRKSEVPFQSNQRLPSSVKTLSPQSWRYAHYLREELKLSKGTQPPHKSMLKTALELILTQEDYNLENNNNRINVAIEALSCVDEMRSIKQIAKSLGLSYSSLNRLITSHTGKSPKSIQQNARFTLAMEKLAFTKERISTIAYSIGYENISSFTNAFDREYGITPSEFRSRASTD